MKRGMSKATSWMSDFDDDLNLDDFAFAKPLPPKRHSTQLLAVNKSSKGSLWSEKHSPKSANQLAVHPKKIEEVKSWLLKQNNSSRRPGIVIITGPPGCGKTATVQTLANDMAIHVQEWVNPNEHVEYVARDDFMFNDSIPYVSQTAAFRTFMLRANRYNVLGKNGGKIILLEELPSFAFRNTSDFHNILRCYKRQFPVIIIQSETSGKDDRIRTLFPPDFLTELGVDQIHFNPVAPTNLVKALSAIVQAERASGQFQVPDKAVLTSLASSVNGDVRGAINALQFACLKGIKGDLTQVFESHSSLATSSGSNGKRKRIQKVTSKNGKKSEKKLAVIGGKDPTLDLFHAIGKVLYCKRTDEPEQQPLPPHMIKRTRNELVIDPEELLDKIPSSPDSFAAFLHQNYPDFYSNIKDLSQAAENLSIADPFFNEWTHTGKISLTSYGGSVAVRGLCFHNADRTRQFSGLKTFNKPDCYATMKTARSRSTLLSSYFRQGQCLSNEEIATSVAPFYAEYFPSALNDRQREVIVDACKLKDMPRKKVTMINQAKESEFDEDEQKTILAENDVDFMIEDDSD